MPGETATKLTGVLAIGGLDPGGGAGVLADMRAIHAAGAFGCAVVTLLTVQSTRGLVASRPVAASWVIAQAEEVLRGQRIGAIKLGALGSPASVRALSAWLGGLRRSLPLVLDPVIAPTRGKARLLGARAISPMQNLLIPRSTLVTANAPEAAVLTGMRVVTTEDAHLAARALVHLGARAALVKGGHLRGDREVVDVLALGSRVVELRAPRLELSPVHGGGCTLASLIAARLAIHSSRLTDADLLAAIRWSRRHHHASLRACRDIGGPMRVLVP